MTEMENDNSKVLFVDKRRIKSVDDEIGDTTDADLDRKPKFVEELENKLEQNDDRLKEYIRAHKEKMAEIDKLRARLENEAGERANDRFGELVKRLIPVIDDFDRALSQTEETKDNPYLAGTKMLKEKLLGELVKEGLEIIDCAGESFDPEKAQAVDTVQVDDEHDDNRVMEQVAVGYKFGDKILKPALVRVGRKI